jgi:hypothetical protein
MKFQVDSTLAGHRAWERNGPEREREYGLEQVEFSGGADKNKNNNSTVRKQQNFIFHI